MIHDFLFAILFQSKLYREKNENMLLFLHEFARI